MRKGIYYSLLPGETPEEKFASAARFGFVGVEIPTLGGASDRNRYLAAAAASGIKIPSVMNQAHWASPLSDPDPAVRAKSVEGMMASLETASAVGADTVLLVPAVVKPQICSYQEAWDRSSAEIAKLIPEYAARKVGIGIENVWNKFLLSPLEFNRYIDAFGSPWVGAYFDVGNIMAYGYPEQWIVSLGRRLRKVHVKGFKIEDRTWCSLLASSIDWAAVMRAFRQVGYDDIITGELTGAGDTHEARMTNISTDMDKILAM